MHIQAAQEHLAIKRLGRLIARPFGTFSFLLPPCFLCPLPRALSRQLLVVFCSLGSGHLPFPGQSAAQLGAMQGACVAPIST